MSYHLGWLGLVTSVAGINGRITVQHIERFQKILKFLIIWTVYSFVTLPIY